MLYFSIVSNLRKLMVYRSHRMAIQLVAVRFAFKRTRRVGSFLRLKCECERHVDHWQTSEWKSQTTNTSISADSRTYGFGNNGGTGATSAGGGGGGAGAAGTNAPGSASAGTGGIGKQYDISGTSTYYAGGGGGGVTSAAGGLGGGGAGTSGGTGNPGTANTGGGGGGAAGSPVSTGGAGGSGIVIIRYPDTTPAASSTTGSPTITVAGGYRVYEFTASGSITF